MGTNLIGLLSKKLGVAGTAIAVIATLPITPPIKGIIIGAVAIAYIVSQAIVDRGKENTKVQMAMIDRSAQLGKDLASAGIVVNKPIDPSLN